MRVESWWAGVAWKDPTGTESGWCCIFRKPSRDYEDIIAKDGLNSSHAIIKTVPSRKGSITFCREYSKDYSIKCIEDGLYNELIGVITADCSTGRFVDFSGGRFQFIGKNNNTNGDITADYLIKDLKTGEILDGSSASGYGVEGGIFKALCPLAAPAAF
jgi:hypothetical protein